MENKADLFNLYWENTKLNEKNIIQFVEGFGVGSGQAQDDYGDIRYPTLDLPMRLPKDRLFKLMCQRKSQREFNSYSLTRKQISSLFSGFAEVNTRRLLPSAGAKYPIEVYAMIFHSDEMLKNKVVYYHYRENALSIIGESPPWKDLEKSTGLLMEGKGEPSILFLFVAFPERVTEKYAERGGRFLLIEAGHYLQNLSLRTVQEKLEGVELGGLFDDDIKKLLGLHNTSAMITLGMVCGK